MMVEVHLEPVRIEERSGRTVLVCKVVKLVYIGEEVETVQVSN